MAKGKKRYRKEIRMNEKEHSTMVRNARKLGLNETAYIKHLMSSTSDIDPRLLRAINNLKTEVNYIGHNINQIVKCYHSNIFTEVDKKRLMEYMRILNEKVDELIADGNK